MNTYAGTPLRWVAGCLVAAGASWAADPYTMYTAATDVNVWDVAVQDVTGDGKAEVFVLCCDEKSDPLVKFVQVYPADEDGKYLVRQPFRIDLPPEVGALFFAEVDGAPPKELIAADAEGAAVYKYSDGRFLSSDAPRFSSLLPSGTREPIFLKDASEDLDGDGLDEWLLPVASGYEVRRATGLVCRAPCDIRSEIHTDLGVYVSHDLPACHCFQRSGEPRKDLALVSDERADFAYGENWAQHSRFKIPLNLEDKWESVTRMEDIDGNTFPDIVVSQFKGTIRLRAVTHVYLASAPFQYPSKPNAAFESSGAVSSPAPHDVDGDGKKDLVFVSVPFGVKNIVNYFVRGKVSARVDVHLFKDGGFAQKPDFSDTLTLDAPEGRERVAYTVGDFNGDGRIDVAFGSGSAKLAIHAGDSGHFIGPRPWVEIGVPAFGVARAVDLNGNKSKDLVLFHPGGENKKRVEIVVF